MQIVFKTQQKPQDYTADSNDFCGEYPDAPLKCLFKDCNKPIPMKKHGYYFRYLITIIYCGRIKIRRYKCSKCGRTVSMLPAFCLAYYTYGVEIIISLIKQAITESIRKAVNDHRAARRHTNPISRNHVRRYLTRLRRNRTLIQYGFNQISPGAVKIDDSPGDIEWTRRILTGKRCALCPETNADFHKEMGMSFMSTHNNIA